MPVSHARVTTLTSTDYELPGLLEVLARVPDPRTRRGRRYTLVFMLAVAVACVLAGAKNFREIGDQAGDLPQEVLARLGGRPHPLLRMIIAPSEKRIRAVLQEIDAAALDALTGGWLRELADAGRLENLLRAIAIDGKWLRGIGDGQQVKLFAARLHQQKGLLRRPQGLPAVPPRQPPPQPRDPHGHGHPDPLPAHQGPRLLQQETSRRQNPERSAARAQTPDHRRHLQVPARRRPARSSRRSEEPGRATGEPLFIQGGRLAPRPPALRASHSRACPPPYDPYCSLSRAAAISCERAVESRTGRSPAAQRRPQGVLDAARPRADNAGGGKGGHTGRIWAGRVEAAAFAESDFRVLSSGGLGQ